MEGFYTYLKLTLSEEEMQQITHLLIEKSIEKGELILKAGDICGHSFFVESGLLRSYSLDESGKEHVIQFAPENWIISDRSSTVFNEPSEFYIEAIEKSKIVMFDLDFVKKASEISSKYIEFNQRALNNHIRHQQKRINRLLSATAEERYLNFIELYPNIPLRVPQWMIASYLGITPESLSRVRKELSRKNFRAG